MPEGRWEDYFKFYEGDEELHLTLSVTMQQYLYLYKTPEMEHRVFEISYDKVPDLMTYAREKVVEYKNSILTAETWAREGLTYGVIELMRHPTKEPVGAIDGAKYDPEEDYAFLYEQIAVLYGFIEACKEYLND
jgi:hypothetical protein